MEFLNYLSQFIRAATIMDVVDILIVAYIIYRLAKFVKDTTAGRLIKGFVLLLLVMQISDWVNLYVINYMLSYVMKYGLLAVLIIFQPEIRKGLEQVGKTKLASIINTKDGLGPNVRTILQTVEACTSMSWSKTGALIVFERVDKLEEIIRTGTLIDAEVSSELVKNVFYPKAPLHDGAMIIRAGRVCCAGCVLPLSSNQHLAKELGTRHRAAVGMSEASDAVVLIVSEETGSISVAIGGMLKRNLSPEMLEKLLTRELVSENSKEENPNKNKKFKLRWKGKSK